MIKISLLAGLVSLFVVTHLHAQVFPGEGSVLNYRIIGFSFPAKNNKDTVLVQLAAGNYDITDSFSKNIISTISCTGGKAIIEAPAFGAQYTWRFVTKTRDPARQADSASPVLYHFSTGWIPEMDTAATRLRVIENTGQYNGAYVFVDGVGMLYDMNGRPVWYLPGVDSEGTVPVDMKLSLFGTITFMRGSRIYEVDYGGRVLWKGPDKGTVSGDSISEYYHHEFTRLANGHYMVLGSEKVGGNVQNPAPAGAATTSDSNDISYGNIVEYDEQGNVVWSWKSRNYFVHSDIGTYINSSRVRLRDVHENSFFLDEKTKMLYVGFHNVSRIVKLKYPESDVVGVYGEKFREGTAVKNDGIFCRQHACIITQNGDLCIYNNNDCHWPSPPEVVIARQQPGGGLEKVWEFPCNIEGMEIGKDDQGWQRHTQATTGGNMMELPDGNIFVSMCSPYGNVFIVTLDKKVVWNGVMERNRPGKGWRLRPHYRASIIANSKDMERLVWNRQDAIPNHDNTATASGTNR